MRKYLLLLSVIVLTGAVTAFTASMGSVKTSSSPESPALLQIEVENNNSQVQRYKLSHEFSKSGWVYYDSYKTIQPSETAVFNISIAPDEEAIQNRYNIQLHLTEQSTDKTKTFSDIISVQRQNIINVKDLKYSKNQYKPGESVEYSITVQNLASRILSEYKINSSLDNDTRTIEGEPFAPGALKTYSFSYNIPKKAAPGNRTLKTSIEHSKNLQNFQKIIKVEEIRNITKETSETNRGLFISGTVDIENNGNSKVNIEEDMKFPTHVKPILSFNTPPSSITENGSRATYFWNTTIKPGEKVSYSYSINYWMPLVLAASIMSALILLRKLTGNIKINKSTENDGNKIKVSLTIENHSSNAKDVIEIKDFVPNVVNLDEDFEMTKPEIKRTTDGTELYWALEDFKPGEKRVITYKVDQKVEVEGGVKLPHAEIVEDGKTVSKSK